MKTPSKLEQTLEQELEQTFRINELRCSNDLINK